MVSILCLLILGATGVRAADVGTNVTTVRQTGEQPIELPGIRIHDKKNFRRLVRIRGVLDSVMTSRLGGNWYWATLRTPTIKVGLTSRDIAATLGIAYETVKDNLKKIFVALDASTRAETVSKALGQGLIAP